MDSTFLIYVRSVLKRWTGLQLAIMCGMGGCYSREKEVWFANEIENFFKNNDDLYQDEVEEFIVAILDQEFDTVAEDGSVKEISSDLCKVFGLCQMGNEQEVLNLISQKSVVTSATTASVADERIDEEVEEPPLLTSELQRLNVADEVMTTPSVDVDGWTEVRRGRKHN